MAVGVVSKQVQRKYANENKETDQAHSHHNHSRINCMSMRSLFCNGPGQQLSRPDYLLRNTSLRRFYHLSSGSVGYCLGFTTLQLPASPDDVTGCGLCLTADQSSHKSLWDQWGMDVSAVKVHFCRQV